MMGRTLYGVHLHGEGGRLRRQRSYDPPRRLAYCMGWRSAPLTQVISTTQRQDTHHHQHRALYHRIAPDFREMSWRTP